MSDVDRALAWASSVRAERAAFVAALEHGTVGVDELAASVRSASDAITSLRLLPCIEAMPAAGGKVRSRRSMAAAGLSEDVALGDVDADAWSALAALIHGDPS